MAHPPTENAGHESQERLLVVRQTPCFRKFLIPQNWIVRQPQLAEAGFCLTKQVLVHHRAIALQNLLYFGSDRLDRLQNEP
ncbi:hypothetical protein [Vacuolonema iberomarrocanum]|uniref:hypothetical protein n=1 Tax=Vacuolonema iberomarrocanum TaxID=3454632 RepID=UPI001A0D66FA|nr:hypothetical protein [filamentous cyanobacterium LEGE 07170]